MNPLSSLGEIRWSLNLGETSLVRRGCKMLKSGLHIQGKFPEQEGKLLEKKLIGNSYRRTPACCG